MIIIVVLMFKKNYKKTNDICYFFLLINYINRKYFLKDFFLIKLISTCGIVYWCNKIKCLQCQI